MSVGLVCPQCDAFAEVGSVRCPACGAPLGWDGVSQGASRGADQRARMEANMSMKSCPTCGNQVPVDDLFCGKCGSRLGPGDGAPMTGKTMFFSGVQQQANRAKLVLVKG